MEKGLFLINTICAILHLVFELYFKDTPYKYHGFILVENMIITLLFIVLAVYSLLSIKNKRYNWINMVFWVSFFCIILIIKPSHTTLELCRDWLPDVAQWVILATMGGVAVLLSVLTELKTSRK